MAPRGASRFAIPGSNTTSKQLDCWNHSRRNFLTALVGLGVSTVMPCGSLLAVENAKPKGESPMR